jgi:MoaA/NifB/PqqE/SkfB family radical SAM enzyme
MLGLDVVWFQVTGTLCNLACAHCLVTSGPGERRFLPLDRETVRRRVEEATALGVREFYFTGGEPFLSREMVEILADTLAYAPATVLTNGMLVTETVAGGLARAADRSDYSLEIRVSLDSWDEARNDAIRGTGCFRGALRGIRNLADRGLLPIVTATAVWPAEEDALARAAFVSLLREAGVARPRLKILPPFRVGREADRSGGYRPDERLEGPFPEGYDPGLLQCTSGRMVTDRGVHVCPILIDEPAARMGGTLAETLRPFPLAHGACHTCFVTGMTCANRAAGAGT